jgi:3-hydroxybutyryl-CoA dehydrogenase
MSTIKTVAVVGGGQMGGGIAQVAAVSGHAVILFDKFAPQLDKARSDHGKRLAREVEKAKMDAAAKDAALARIKYTSNLAEIAGADIVIADLFGQFARMFTGEQILASNTSSISITQIAAAADKAVPGTSSRVIGMHFFNPVPIMKLVEVINGLETSKQTTERVLALSTAMGKTAVPANDRPGFVSNRVLMPMINEAFYALMEGVAEPKDIDEIMKLGCNFPMGPLNLADFIGLDTCVHIMDVLADGLNNDRYRACPLLKQLVTAGRLGVKSGRGVFDYSKRA